MASMVDNRRHEAEINFGHAALWLQGLIDKSSFQTIPHFKPICLVGKQRVKNDTQKQCVSILPHTTQCVLILLSSLEEEKMTKIFYTKSTSTFARKKSGPFSNVFLSSYESQKQLLIFLILYFVGSNKCWFFFIINISCVHLLMLDPIFIAFLDKNSVCECMLYKNMQTS